MKIISVFNNKGGVGKTTLTYHLASALAEMGRKVLMLDLDPQCNLTVYGIDTEKLHKIWQQEDRFIETFDLVRNQFTPEEFELFNDNPRTIHYILKPTEEGTSPLTHLPPPIQVSENLDLVPGRLTLHMYENKIAERWAGLYQKDPLSIRTVTQIRKTACEYGSQMNYDFIIIDTSPNLGALNKVIISTVDGFLVPCLPGMFSLYGIRNIGKSLSQWKEDFVNIYYLLSRSNIAAEHRNQFPEKFVKFLGFTIYNAKKYSSPKNPLNLAQAASNYAQDIPATIREFISDEVRQHLNDEMLNNPIGGQSVMHTHNTFPSMAQKYRVPMWKVPDVSELDKEDKSTIKGNQAVYRKTQESYQKFAEDLMTRVALLD